MLARLAIVTAPALFVLLWSTGFIGARNADQRQEARNPAKGRARQYDVAVVQDKQNPD
jgi:hypothetical protein